MTWLSDRLGRAWCRTWHLWLHTPASGHCGSVAVSFCLTCGRYYERDRKGFEYVGRDEESVRAVASRYSCSSLMK